VKRFAARANRAKLARMSVQKGAFMDFDAMFVAATGQAPYPYQRTLAANGLSDLLVAPTGAGKTAAAVLPWLWRRRFASKEVREGTPRRLVFCLPMRTLVEQTQTAIGTWLNRLALNPMVAVHAMLGGAVDDTWELSVDEDAIIVGTQDQLLSRALNRGYAMSRYRWPVHFGLLHNDVQWVLDEVQLMGPGLSTSAQLEGLRRAIGTAGPARTMWMSATLAEGRLRTVDMAAHPLGRTTLSDEDKSDPRLKPRLTATKPIQRAETRLTDDFQAYASGLAREVAARHVEGTLTLVVVNRVARAQAIVRELRKQKVPARLIHSRFRPHERRAVQAEALAPGATGILVATQAIEAGVDISSKTLFTEIAPWSSLVQRFGRCNRGGEYSDGGARVFLVDANEADVSPSLARPYNVEELALARHKVKNLKDVGPASLSLVPAEEEIPVLPVIRRRDLLELFDTEPDLAGHDVDVGRFVRATDDRDVAVFWRDIDASPTAEMSAPARDELCSVPVWDVEKLIAKHGGWRWNHADREWQKVDPKKLFPGLVVALPRRAGGYDDTLGFTGSPHDVPSAIALSEPVGPEDDDGDELTQAKIYYALDRHSSDVALEASSIAARIGGTSTPWPVIERAARWHDLGKAHEAFQQALVAGLADSDPARWGGPWAKSGLGQDGRPGSKRASRRFFRHELASALAYLVHAQDDLGAYLVAAHHGKVRLAIKPRPQEKGPTDGRRFAFGVYDGDKLPVVNLGDGVTVPQTTLSLELMELGETSGASWTERCLRLLEEHGPFRLAYWEALVRVADWRASKKIGVEVTRG
jgi:CRISPR-associated endonuclease/helicase Cas3